MNYRTAIEHLHPDVEYRWKGESSPGHPDLENYDNIVDWDRNNTGIPKPTPAQLQAEWAEIVAERQAQANAEQQAELDRQAALAEVLLRYDNLKDDTFLEIVAKVDQWSATLQADIDTAQTIQEVKSVVKRGFGDLANYIGPVVAFVIVNRENVRGK